LRFSESTRVVRQQINDDNSQYFAPPLVPGETTPLNSYPIGNILTPSSTSYILEVQPVIFQDRRYVPCRNVVITQPIECSESAGPIPTSWTHQENADYSECALNWNTSQPCANTIDGDLNTYGNKGPAVFPGILYVNYTIPATATDQSIFQIKDESGITNITASTSFADCWDNGELNFQFYALSSISISCFNGTEYNILQTLPSGNFYEESMWWHTT